MGSTRYLNLIPKIQNLFGCRRLVFHCCYRFFWNHSPSTCGFFRSIDPGNTGSSGSFDSFGILCSSLAFGIQEIILLWKSDFGDSAAGPILPDLAGFFNYHDGPALLSFLVAALPVILNRLPRVSWPWFYLPWCVYNIPHKKPGVYWQSRYTYDVLFVYLLHWKMRGFGAIIKMLECIPASLLWVHCFFAAGASEKPLLFNVLYIGQRKGRQKTSKNFSKICWQTVYPGV